MKLTSMVLVLLACASTLSNAHAADSDKKVTVSGQCTAEVSPDRGSIVFVIENTEKDVKQAISKTTDLHEKLRAEFKRLTIKDLELSTSEYSVYEKKEWEKDKSVSKGFSARLGVKATTPEIAKMGELIAIAARLGVKETNALSTYLSPQKLLDEKKKCLDGAAKDAREKAEALTKSLNARLGRVLQINERGSISSSPMQPMYEARALHKSMAADAGAAPSIEGQKQTLTQEVDVSFAIE
jgi:uncharacterized protein YggE